MDEAVRIQDEFYILATQSRADERTRVLKQGETFAVFDRFGDLPATPASEYGLYHGGTRHLSAAQFVHDQQDAVALVASQDGRFTVFAWSSCDNMVYAHRVEALLL